MYNYSTPLFDSWMGEEGEILSQITIMPVNTDAESEFETQSGEPLVISSDDSKIPPNRVRDSAECRRMPGSITPDEVAKLFSSSSISEEDSHNTTLVALSPAPVPVTSEHLQVARPKTRSAIEK